MGRPVSDRTAFERARHPSFSERKGYCVGTSAVVNHYFGASSCQLYQASRLSPGWPLRSCALVRVYLLPAWGSRLADMDRRTQGRHDAGMTNQPERGVAG
jgi:hypothetical protein